MERIISELSNRSRDPSASRSPLVNTLGNPLNSIDRSDSALHQLNSMINNGMVNPSSQDSDEIMIIDEVPTQTPGTYGVSTMSDSSRTTTPNSATSQAFTLAPSQEKVLRDALAWGMILNQDNLKKLTTKTCMSELQIKTWFYKERKKAKSVARVSYQTLPIPTVPNQGLRPSTSNGLASNVDVAREIILTHPETPHMELDGNALVEVGKNLPKDLSNPSPKPNKQVFYVNKERITTGSKYMQTLFFIHSRENRPGPVTVSTMDPDTFKTFLDAIHPDSPPVNDQTVERLLNLSDRFDASILRWKCEGFLLGPTCQMGTLAKMKLADDYGLTNVIELTIDKMKTVNDFKRFFKIVDKRGFDHKVLSDHAKARLYEKLSTLL